MADVGLLRCEVRYSQAFAESGVLLLRLDTSSLLRLYIKAFLHLRSIGICSTISGYSELKLGCEDAGQNDDEPHKIKLAVSTRRYCSIFWLRAQILEGCSSPRRGEI